MAVLLDHDDVNALLRELARRLHADGVTAGIRVVGGAAISLMNSDRRSTADIDAVLLPAAPVRAMAALMAIERDLPADWLNDAALAYVPLVGLDDWHEVFRVGDVTVSIASVQMLLAMKLRANRGRRDTADIEYLLDRCNVTAVEEAQEIYERYHAQDMLSDSAVARVQAWLGNGLTTTRSGTEANPAPARHLDQNRRPPDRPTLGVANCHPPHTT